jgi:hypothetical protein
MSEYQVPPKRMSLVGYDPVELGRRAYADLVMLHDWMPVYFGKVGLGWFWTNQQGEMKYFSTTGPDYK